jgi:pimeloyl-ACP methyl ester carboxylesterase
MIEEVIRFGPSHSLVGIVSRPCGAPANADLPAVVLLNAGLIHRIGPNRIYVQIARALARLGFTVLRFDFSGVGDSRPRLDHLPYVQSAPAEAREAMDWLAAHYGRQQFVLMGHCSGAGFSFLLAGQDERVVGAAIINFEGGSEEWTEFDRRRKVSRQIAAEYRREALLSRSHWSKLLTGRADYYSIARNLLKGVLWYRITESGFRIRQAVAGRQHVNGDSFAAKAQAELRQMIERDTQVVFIHSEGSTGQELMRFALGEEIERLQATGRVQVVVIPQSDHLFTLVARQRLVTQTLADWAQSHWCAIPAHG